MEDSIVIPKIIATGLIKSLPEIQSCFEEDGNKEKEEVALSKKTVQALVRLIYQVALHINRQNEGACKFDYSLPEREAATYCDCTVTKLREFRKDGLLEHIKIGNRIRYTKGGLDHFLLNNPRTE